MWWWWVVRAVGVILVLAVGEDIFYTVLFPGSGRGALSVPLGRGTWRLFRLAARVAPRRRGRLLAYSGPVLVTVNVTAWVLLLATGFAFIDWPALGSAIRASSGPTPTGFATALYYSAYALTTLGTGDIVAKTDLYRLLMVLEAALGFSTITLILTYFLSVYSALTRRDTFALSVQYRAAGTGDAAELLARLGPGGDFGGATQTVGDVATSVLSVMASHRAYPILRYFHFRHTYDALPRLLLVALDLATLIESALDADQNRALVDSAAAAELGGGGRHVLDELAATFLPAGQPRHPSMSEQAWRARYDRAVTRLRAAGIATTPDHEAGARRYVALRREWDPRLAALAAYLMYDWDAIAPADHAESAQGDGRPTPP